MNERALQDRPRHRPGTRLARRDGSAVVEDAEGQLLCQLNDTASALWELCDGTTTAGEMVDAVCQLWNAGREEVTAAVVKTVADLRAAGAIVEE